MKGLAIKLKNHIRKHKKTIAYIGIGVALILLLLSQLPPRRDPKQKSFLGQPNKPRGVRNNNPGNIRYSPLNLWEGKIPYTQNTDSSFEQFIEWRYGIRALLLLLKKYIFRYGTIEEMIRVYAPSVENNTENYIRTVSAETGIPRNQAITSDKGTLQKLAIAITRHECGEGYQITEEDFNNAYKIM